MGSSKSQEQTIGYKYFLGIHKILCHGPVDKITKFFVGERTAHEQEITYTPGQSIVNVDINSPELFGGEKKEGGVQGSLDVMFGASDQIQNSYLQSQLGTNIPAFRGVVSLVVKQMYLSAMSPYPKSWWAEVVNTSFGGWYSEKSNVISGGTDGSANGAHIIREAFVNQDWGMGYPITQPDDTTCREVADTLYDENFGLSLLLSGEGSANDVKQEVL